MLLPEADIAIKASPFLNGICNASTASYAWAFNPNCVNANEPKRLTTYESPVPIKKIREAFNIQIQLILLLSAS